jgi:molybdopterin-guanine dinucleotide biosynthesis protein A
LPAVVWVDSEGRQVFIAAGDAPLDLFRTVVETARDRAPDVEPSPSLAASRKAAEALHAALKSGDTKAALRAIHDVGEVKRPKALVDEARAVEEQIGKRGAEELAKAKGLIEAGKKAEAKEALQKLKQSYGDHPVGQEAWSLLRKLAEDEK